MPLLRITTIASHVAQTSPGNTQEHRQILADLKDVRNRMGTEADPRVVETLDGAILLMTTILQIGELAGREILAVVARLLEYMQGRLIQGPERSETYVPPTLRFAGPGGTGASPAGDLCILGDMQLGEILVQMGAIQAGDIYDALAASHGLNIRFGEAIVHNRAASESQVREALERQEAFRRRGHAAPDLPQKPARSGPVVLRYVEHDGHGKGLELLSDIMLGEILVRGGSITREQLEQALANQRGSGQRLGELLIGQGLVDRDRVEAALEQQGMLRRSA